MLLGLVRPEKILYIGGSDVLPPRCRREEERTLIARLAEGDEQARQALENLPEREQTIVRMRFGLGGRPEKTQKEVADLMGISQSYISRLEKRIMTRLRREISRQIYV